MKEDRTRFMSQGAVRAMLRLAEEVHRRGAENVMPPEILAKRRQLADAIRNAELFMARTGAVDNGMVFLAADLRLELEQLYADWCESEAR